MESTKRQIITSLLGLTLCVSPVTAQVFDSGPSDPALFDIVMNLPPDPNIGDRQRIGGDGSFTQLNLSDGGSIGDSLLANIGSEVNVSGGSVGDGLFAEVGTEVNVSGGSVGDNFHANFGIEVNISGGSVGNGFFAEVGTKVNISGGTVGNNFSAVRESVVDISSGTIGDDFLAEGEVNLSGGTVGNEFQVRVGVVNINGGTVGDGFFANFISDVNISGGTVGDDFHAIRGSEVNLFGSEFFLDGVLLDGLTIGDAFTIVDRDVTLSGLLADGSAISFDLNSTRRFDEDWFDPNATLTVTLVPEPGSFMLLASALCMFGFIRRR